MGSVSLEEVTKVFQEGDGVVAVDNLDLDVQDGEFLVLVGPSGCGKSTTLRMVAGLETPTSGRLRIDNNDITDLTPQERNIAMVFQSYALYPHMTVAQNMSFGLEESTDLSKEAIKNRVRETAEMLGMEELLDRNPSELSGGQQQRVALGRSLVREPEVFLLDEPLANLDAKLRAEMRTELQQLQEDIGTTTIYVTHDQTEAMTMSDRIAILNEGELQQVGTPLECYHDPANTFVAGFLGEPSMNFFEVSHEDGNLVGDHIEFPLPEDIASEITSTGTMTLGIRPERIDIVSNEENPYDIRAIAEVIEPLGDENTLHLRFPDQPEDATTFTASVDGRSHHESGDEVVVRLPPDALHLFDGETGEALFSRDFEEDAQLEIGPE